MKEVLIIAGVLVGVYVIVRVLQPAPMTPAAVTISPAAAMAKLRAGRNVNALNLGGA